MITEDQLRAAADELARGEPDLLRLFSASELRARLEDFVAALLAQGRERAVFQRED